MKFSNLKNKFIHFSVLGVLASVIWLKLFPIGIGFYSDSFHHGEYIASLQSILAGNLKFFTIHGAMDWVPALFSQQFYGASQYFLPTMLVYQCLSALAALILYCIFVLLTNQNNQYRAVIHISIALLAVNLVGVRDLFLLLSIWIYLLTDRCLSKKWKIALELGLGVALAVNLFWSFDRGFVGLATMALPRLIMITKEKRYLLSILSLISSLLLLHFFGALSFSNYFANFQFLIATSSQWSYGFKKNPVILSSLVGVLNGWVIYYLLKQLNETIRVNWIETANLYTLVILIVLMYKIGVNRADGGHVIMTLWAPGIAFLYLHEKYSIKLSIISIFLVIFIIIFLAKKTGITALNFGLLLPAIYCFQKTFSRYSANLASNKIAIIMLAIPIIFINTFKILDLLSKGEFNWIYKISAAPTNQSLVNESVLWVSREILKAGSSCVFDLSNNGVINGITNLPACTKYIYPVYASKQYEADMLKELQQKNPPAVVFSSTYWSFRIDENSMHHRFPDLKKYLIKTYPYKKCNLGYCILLKDNSTLKAE